VRSGGTHKHHVQLLLTHLKLIFCYTHSQNQKELIRLAIPATLILLFGWTAACSWRLTGGAWVCSGACWGADAGTEVWLEGYQVWATPPEDILKTYNTSARTSHIASYIWLTSQSSVLLEKPSVAQLIQEFPNILWNPKVHYCVQNSLPRQLSWARSINSIQPHSTSRKFILIFPSMLRFSQWSLSFWLFHQNWT
jgi:hypothetical protein